jgi:hypothetical protein
MVGLDTSSPPVIFVVGTAGAGKSSLVTSFQRWSRFIETEAIAVNLDPGAERVHYDAEFDVRDVISLTEVMNEYDLGPNGAQILAADLVAAQALDVAEELHALSGELIIVDTPGQVELFAFREASSHLIEVLGQDQAAIIYLFAHLDSYPRCYCRALSNSDWAFLRRTSYRNLTYSKKKIWRKFWNGQKDWKS